MERVRSVQQAHHDTEAVGDTPCSSCPAHMTSFQGAQELAECLCVPGYSANRGACTYTPICDFWHASNLISTRLLILYSQNLRGAFMRRVYGRNVENICIYVYEHRRRSGTVVQKKGGGT